MRLLPIEAVASLDAVSGIEAEARVHPQFYTVLKRASPSLKLNLVQQSRTVARQNADTAGSSAQAPAHDNGDAKEKNSKEVGVHVLEDSSVPQDHVWINASARQQLFQSESSETAITDGRFELLR